MSGDDQILTRGTQHGRALVLCLNCDRGLHGGPAPKLITTYGAGLCGCACHVLPQGGQRGAPGADTGRSEKGAPAAQGAPRSQNKRGGA